LTWLHRRDASIHGLNFFCNISCKLFVNDDITFENDFVKKFVKVTQARVIDELEFDDLIAKNGKKLTRETIYAAYYAEKYGVTPQAIRRIIKAEGNRCEEASKV